MIKLSPELRVTGARAASRSYRTGLGEIDDETLRSNYHKATQLLCDLLSTNVLRAPERPRAMRCSGFQLQRTPRALTSELPYTIKPQEYIILARRHPPFNKQIPPPAQDVFTFSRPSVQPKRFHPYLPTGCEGRNRQATDCQDGNEPASRSERVRGGKAERRLHPLSCKFYVTRKMLSVSPFLSIPDCAS